MQISTNLTEVVAVIAGVRSPLAAPLHVRFLGKARLLHWVLVPRRLRPEELIVKSRVQAIEF